LRIPTRYGKLRRECLVMQDAIQTYDSESPAYRAAFRTFLRHTDQKLRAREWLQRFAKKLPLRRLLTDVGAGDGTLTTALSPLFARTIAIEPNPSLRVALAEICPRAEILPQPIQQVDLPLGADLVVCSFVLVYLPEADRREALEKLASSLSPDGALVVIQHTNDNDAQRMFRHFGYCGSNLRAEAGRFAAQYAADFYLEINPIPSTVKAPTFDTAYTIAEFMLNAVLAADPPAQRGVADYVRQHFVSASGHARFSCDQEALIVRRT